MLQTYIVIELEAHTLSLYQNGHLQQTFPVALGKQNTPTPTGNWHIINKKILTDSGPFGSRWMGLNHHDYGIHGTNNPAPSAAMYLWAVFVCITPMLNNCLTLFPSAHR